MYVMGESEVSMMKKITKIDELPQGQLPTTKLRVAAYARVSTDSDEQLESLKAQREHYERYIKSNPEWGICWSLL